MQRIKREDKVIIIAGKDKGKKGKVIKVIKNDSKTIIKLVIEGINLVKKHVKPDLNKGIQGGVLEKEAPIHASNVAIYNQQTEKADRIGFKTLDDGRKVRYLKSNGELVDV